ncbi:hypothetical protein BsWGS_26690 [Bradybaena similaris]
MGLDTFPLLQDQTVLFVYKNTVFKLKLDYQHVSQQMKEAFAEVVSERAAHCQIEDVCRALLYNIEREEPISPIQSEHFVIYPEVHRWPLANKVQFFVHGKQLSCHRDLILLKLYCKSISLSVPDQNQIETLSSPVNKIKSPTCSHDTSQLNPRSEKSDKENASTSCSGDININNNKSSLEAVPSTQYKTSVCETSVARLSSGIESVGPDSNHTVTKLPEQHCSEVSNCATSSDEYSHMETRHLGTSFTKETAAGKASSDKSKVKKTMDPHPRGRYDHNVSRKIKHQVDKISSDNSRQSTQRAPKLACSMLNNPTTLQTEQPPQSEVPHTDSNTEHLYSTDVQTCQVVHAAHRPTRQSARCDEEPSGDQYEVVYERNLKVMPKRITRSELQKGSACNNSLHEDFRKSPRRCVESQFTRRVTTSTPYRSMVRSVKTRAGSNGATLARTNKYTHGRNTSANVSKTIKKSIKQSGSCDDMKSSGSSEISDKDVVEVSADGRTLYKSEQKIDHDRVTPVSPSVTLRNRKMKQNNSPEYSYDTNDHHQVRRCRSRSTESGKARRLPGQKNSKNIVYERRQIKGHNVVPANKTSSDSSHNSARGRRIATKYNYGGEQRMPQTKYGDSLKKKVVHLKIKEKAAFHINKQVAQTTDSQKKSYSCDSVSQITRSSSASSFSGETDTTCRSLRSARKDLLPSKQLSSKKGRKNLLLSPQLSSNRGRKDLLLSPQLGSKKGRKDLLLSPQLGSNRGRKDLLLSPQLGSKKGRKGLLLSSQLGSKKGRKDLLLSPQPSSKKRRQDLLLSPQLGSNRGRKDLLLSPQPSSNRGRKDLLLSPQPSSKKRRKDLLLSPQLRSNRRNCVPDALVKARQHLLAAKDGVWLF